MFRHIKPNFFFFGIDANTNGILEGKPNDGGEDYNVYPNGKHALKLRNKLLDTGQLTKNTAGKSSSYTAYQVNANRPHWIVYLLVNHYNTEVNKHAGNGSDDN